VHETPLPFDVTSEGVEARVLSAATLQEIDRPARPASPEETTPSRPSAGTPEPSQDPSFPENPEVTVTPQAFSLPEAIAFGLRNNPRLLAALAGIERARGQEQVAFAPFLPELNLITHGGVTSPALGPAGGGATGIILSTANETHSYVQAELQVQWTLCDFGRTAGRYQQAEARARIAELQSVRAEQTIAFEVAVAYLQTLRREAARRIQEEAIRRDEATLRDTRARRAAGVAERDDVLRAEVQLAAGQEDLDLAREAELEALARLNNAMGRNASLPLAVTGCDAQPPFDVTLVQSLAEAAARRPEIGIARGAVAAAQSGRRAAAAEFLPRVYALGSVGDVGGSHILPGSQEGAGLHIDVPLFTGFKRRGELRAADAEIQQAVADARSLLDGVTLQVTTAYLAASTAHRRIARDRPAIVEATEYLRLVRNRYQNGQATPTDIVDAETALTRAQQRLTAAVYEYLAALVSLDYALGDPPGHRLGLADATPAGADHK
jgi:outer membrane protein TolC